MKKNQIKIIKSYNRWIAIFMKGGTERIVSKIVIKNYFLMEEK